MDKRPVAVIDLRQKGDMPVLRDTLNRQALPPKPFWHMITDHGVRMDTSLCIQDFYGDTIYYNADSEDDSRSLWRAWLREVK